jgi:hypothetical protein
VKHNLYPVFPLYLKHINKSKTPYGSAIKIVINKVISTLNV